MTGSRTEIWPVAKPNRSGPLTAFALILKLVRLSGSLTWTLATPLASTISDGL